MIRGVGIDIIEIERIQQALVKNKRFLYRIFTKNEIDYFKKNHGMMSTIAGNFAAKEAVMKALGTGLRTFRWRDIEILRDSLGKPFVVLFNNANVIAMHQEITEILITISHSKSHAVAQALAI